MDDPRGRRRLETGSGSEAVELQRTQPQQVDEIARRPKRITDDIAAQGGQRHHERTITLGEQHRLGRHGPVDELRQPANGSRVGRLSGANRDLAALADLACECCR